MKDSTDEGAGIFFTDGQSVLLLKRPANGKNPNSWCLPGGKAKIGESALETARREAREECGRVEGEQFAKDEHHIGNFHWTSYFFKIEKPFNCNINQEHVDWQWFELKMLNNLHLHPELKHKLPTYLKIVRKEFSNSFNEWISR